MPRAKVRDEDRQRARRACLPCKESKIRCNAGSPCDQCVRRNCKDSCQYSERLSKRDRNRGSHNSLAHIRARTFTEVQNKDVANADGDSKRSPEVTHSRMLLSGKGEKLYIGKLASLSLLQFLRQTVSFHAGPCAFSDTASKNVMLEVEVRNSSDIDFGREDVIEKQSLIQYFFKITAGLLDLYSEQEVLDWLSKTVAGNEAQQVSADNQAALCLIIATGGQCRGSRPTDRHYATALFARGQMLAFNGMLSDPTIGMVRTFLVMAFYMLGACRRNAAFMYLGVAAKAAYAIGLHSTSHYANLSKSERIVRNKTWKSLYVLDTLVNTILGRPITLPPTTSPAPESVRESQKHKDKSQLLEASYSICSRICSVIPKISKGTGADFTFTETFLEKLGRWGEQELPQDDFTSGSAFPLEPTQFENVIGNTHVACIYYFTIILVTRAFLLSDLTHKLGQRTSETNKDARRVIDRAQDPRISKLAQVCLDAASYMTQLCQKVMDLNGLAGNLAIMKAFMFAAGLLLGFSYFVDGKASDNEDAFHAAQAVLSRFSRLSPQARHYCEILSDLESISQQYQKRLLEQRRRSTNRYVRQVFAVGSNNDSPQDTDVNHTSRNTDMLNFASSQALAPRSRAAESGTIVDADTFTSSSHHPASAGNVGFGENNDLNADIGDGNGDGGEFSDVMASMLPIDDAMNMPLLWDNFDIDLDGFNAFSMDLVQSSNGSL